MDAQSLLALDAKELLPQPPALDAFMVKQEETMRDLLSKADTSQRLVTRAAVKQQLWAFNDLNNRLMLAATKNNFRYRGPVIDIIPGESLRTYVCQWEDIPETLYGAEGQKEFFAREGDSLMVRWIGALEKTFASKRRQWFNEGRFNISFDDPGAIETSIYAVCYEYSEQEASQLEDPGDDEEEIMRMSKKLEPDVEKRLDRIVCKNAAGQHDILSMTSNKRSKKSF